MGTLPDTFARCIISLGKTYCFLGRDVLTLSPMIETPVNRRIFSLAAGLVGRTVLIVILCGVVLPPLTGCGCSEERGRAAAPKFVASEGTEGEAAAKGTAGKSTSNGTKQSPPEDELFGLPLDIMFEDLPTAPEVLVQPTPLSVVEGR